MRSYACSSNQVNIYACVKRYTPATIWFTFIFIFLYQIINIRYIPFTSLYYNVLDRNNGKWASFLMSLFCSLDNFNQHSWQWSYGSWIYNYLYNHCLSPLILWVRISIRARCTTLCDRVCQWLATCQWFSPGRPVSSTNKTDIHDITEILLKVALNTMKPTTKSMSIAGSPEVGESYSRSLKTNRVLHKTL